MRKAFTLIELLVVITIIGLLLGLIAPRVGDSIRAARAATCRMNLKNLHSAVMSHSVDNNGDLPRAGSYELMGNHHFHEMRGWISWVPLNATETSDGTWPVWNDESPANLGPHHAQPQPPPQPSPPGPRRMKDAGFFDELALRGIRQGTLYRYLARELNVYRCPVAARDDIFRARAWSLGAHSGALNRGRTVRLSYVMNEFFNHGTGGLARWYRRRMTWIGTRESMDAMDAGGGAHNVTPEASRLLLFAEHSGVAWTTSAAIIGKNCVLRIPHDQRALVIDDIANNTIPRLGGYHDGPAKVRDMHGRIIRWGQVVFLDGHFEKVLPMVRRTPLDARYANVRNTAWLLCRGIDSPDK